MTFVGDSSAPVCPWPARHLRGAWNASETFDTVGCMHIPTQREIRYQWERGGPVMTWALIGAWQCGYWRYCWDLLPRA